MIARLLLALFLAGLGASVYANPCALGGHPYPLEAGSGIGGTGLKTGEGDGRGTGGTGREDGTGSGGTGRQARDGDGSGTGGTGVVGVITGFGSVCVNGLEIHYDAGTPVIADGARIAPNQLAVGQMVAVEATGGESHLVARQIHVQHALIGRVEAVAGDRVKVWGQWVSLPGNTGLKSGDRIKVSGYRLHPDSIFATRIDVAQPQEADLISGEVEAVADGVATINGVRVRLPQGGDAVKPGEDIRALGKQDGSGFRAEKVEPAAKRDFVDRVDRMVVQDRIRRGKAGTLRVGGLDFVLGADARIEGGNAKDLQTGRLVKVEARLKNGRPSIERIEIRDESKGLGRKEGTDDSKPARAKGGGRAASAIEERREDARETESSGDHAREGKEESAAERPETPEPTEKFEKTEKPEKAERSEKVEREERSEKPEKAERAERAERTEKTEKLERPEKMEKTEKAEKPEKPEKPEKKHD